jgi:hypothetical protein
MDVRFRGKSGRAAGMWRIAAIAYWFTTVDPKGNSNATSGAAGP